MTYNLADKMTNVSHFIMSESNIILVQNGILIVNAQKFNISPMLLQGDITNNNIWIRDSNWENYLLRISDGSLKKLDFNIGLNGKISNVITIFKDNVLSCFSTEKNKIIVSFPNIEKIKNYISTNECLLFQVETGLKSLSLLTGKYRWEIDLSDFGEIGKMIGVANDILWIGIGGKMLVGISVHGGEIAHLVEKPSHFAYQSGDFNYFRGHEGEIDQKTNRITGFEFDTYYEFDLTTMKFTYWIFREEASSMKLEARYAYQSIHIDNFIYFIDKLNFKIGIFNKQNKTIEEAFVFSNNSCTGFLNDLQVKNDKIYVLDGGGTLHILKKNDI